MYDYSRLSKRAAAVKPSGIRKFFDLVSDMPDAISLGVGEPDFVTPWTFREGAIRSIQKGYTQYTSNMGLPALRTEISEYLRRFGLSYSPADEIFLTVGASEGIDLAMRAIINEGDEVLIPSPSYVSYSPCVTLAGGVPIELDTKIEDSFKLTPKHIEDAVTPRTKALVLPYPNNPTGAVMEKEFLEKILPLIIKHDLLIISDEIYAELTYHGRHTSIASLPGARERTVVISGFSKAFAMTGWRLGYVAGPKEIVALMLKIHQQTLMCAPTASQYAALSALKTGKGDDYAAVSEMRSEYDKRRQYLYRSFLEIGFRCFEPHGAFYIFPDVSPTGLSGEQFAERLLMAEHVAVIPGSAFGAAGQNCVRCCYATAMSSLVIAVNKITKFIESLKK